MRLILLAYLLYVCRIVGQISEEFNIRFEQDVIPTPSESKAATLHSFSHFVLTCSRAMGTALSLQQVTLRIQQLALPQRSERKTDCVWK